MKRFISETLYRRNVWVSIRTKRGLEGDREQAVQLMNLRIK